MYAPESHKNANEFNCVQRAHQNMLENYPQFLLLMGIASIHRPTLAAAAGAIRLVGFVLYALGYQSGDPKKRMQGAVGYIGLLTLIAVDIELAYKLITS